MKSHRGENHLLAANRCAWVLVDNYGKRAIDRFNVSGGHERDSRWPEGQSGLLGHCELYYHLSGWPVSMDYWPQVEKTRFSIDTCAAPPHNHGRSLCQPVSTHDQPL